MWFGLKVRKRSEDETAKERKKDLCLTETQNFKDRRKHLRKKQLKALTWSVLLHASNI